MSVRKTNLMYQLKHKLLSTSVHNSVSKLVLPKTGSLHTFLKSHRDASITPHFAINNSNIYINESELEHLVLSLKTSVQKDVGLILKRSEARQRKLANYFNDSLWLYEILMDKAFFKGKRHDISIEIIKNRISSKNITIVLPAFPRKSPNPLKTNFYQDGAELFSFFQLHRLSCCIGQIPSNSNKYLSKIIIYLDGLYNPSMGQPDYLVNNYQKSLMSMVTYLQNNFVTRMVRLSEFTRSITESIDMNSAHKRLRNISKVVSFDYLCLLDEFTEFTKTKKTSFIFFNKFIDEFPKFVGKNKTFSNSELKTFVDTFIAISYHIFRKDLQVNNPTTNKLALKVYYDLFHADNDLLINKQRLNILNNSLKSTVTYVSNYYARSKYNDYSQFPSQTMNNTTQHLDLDLIQAINPEALRASIHMKPGHYGLRLVGPGTILEPWMGCGYVNKKGVAGVDFRIKLEHEGYIPIYLNQKAVKTLYGTQFSKNIPFLYVDSKFIKDDKLDTEFFDTIRLSR